MVVHMVLLFDRRLLEAREDANSVWNGRSRVVGAFIADRSI
jgi:hypothetical protein